MEVKIFSDSHTQPPNPHPYMYNLCRTERIGEYLILKVQYHGCTTFFGYKLLLLRAKQIPVALDPHLLGNGHPVIARFEPTPDGWNLARLCANSLTKETEGLQ